MKVASPGLVISPRVRVERTRLLPVLGEVIVAAGESVRVDEKVAFATIGGPIHGLNVAFVLGISPKEMGLALLVAEGDAVCSGQIVGLRRSLFGKSFRKALSPVDGVVETVSSTSGQVLIREHPVSFDLRACVGGIVTKVLPGFGVEIAGDVALIQGVFGIGGETFGRLLFLGDDTHKGLSQTSRERQFQGSVVFTERPLRLDVLRFLETRGAQGVVTGSMEGEDIIQYVGKPVNPASTGRENVKVVVMLTEGFGTVKMSNKAFDILSKLEGREVALNGTTQMRAGVIRPELIAPPLPAAKEISRDESQQLREKSSVRVVRGRRFGELGTIREIPKEPRKIETGAIVSVVTVELSGGEIQDVPVQNVEIV